MTKGKKGIKNKNKNISNKVCEKKLKRSSKVVIIKSTVCQNKKNTKKVKTNKIKIQSEFNPNQNININKKINNNSSSIQIMTKRRLKEMKRNETINKIKTEMKESHKKKKENKEYEKIKDKLPPFFKIEPSKLNENNKNCVICLKKFVKGSKGIFLPCLHLFHEKCILKWCLKDEKCPICKTVLFQKEIKKDDVDDDGNIFDINFNFNNSNNRSFLIRINNNNNTNEFYNILNYLDDESESINNDNDNNNWGNNNDNGNINNSFSIQFSLD